MPAIEMPDTKQWTVQVAIEEHEDERVTRAEARLEVTGRAAMVGTGTARRNPEDQQVPRIGDELAAARALSDLAHQLIGLAADDIERVTHVKATLTG